MKAGKRTENENVQKCRTNDNKEEYTKYNIEYVLIKAKMGIVWELMLNMKSFNKFVQVLSDDIDYEGKTLQKGKIVKLIYNISKRALIQEVEVSSLTESENECEIEFYLKEKKNQKIPEQKISLLLYKGEK